VLFLSTALIIGAGSYFLKNYRTKYEQKEFDYSKTDSSFYAGEKSDGLKKDSFKITDKKVDYESELVKGIGKSKLDRIRKFLIIE